MICFGLTGGIGSGKTTIARVFEALGVPVFNSDKVSRDLLNSDAQLQSEVVRAFGETICTRGIIDRQKLGQLVFADPQQLAVLNHLIHPRVANAFVEFKKRHARAPMIVREAAILLEVGATDCDEIIVVTAPLDVRIQRVMKRDGLSKALILDRMARQWTDEQRAPFATVVWNNDGRQLLVPEIIRFIRLKKTV